MSTIHDALKKVSSDSQKETGDKKYLGLGESVRFNAPRSRKMNWGPVFVVLVLVLVTGPAIAPIFQTPVKPTSQASALTTAPTDQKAVDLTQSSTRKDQFGVEEMPLGQLAPKAAMMPVQPEFTLSGIVLSGNDSYCLINDKIVRPGAKIGDAVLTSVTSTKAVLSLNGETIVLNVNP